MPSLFDSPEFNERIFLPGRECTTPPDGAVDRFVEVASDDVEACLRTAFDARGSTGTVTFKFNVRGAGGAAPR